MWFIFLPQCMNSLLEHSINAFIQFYLWKLCEAFALKLINNNDFNLNFLSFKCNGVLKELILMKAITADVDWWTHATNNISIWMQFLMEFSKQLTEHKSISTPGKYLNDSHKKNRDWFAHLHHQAAILWIVRFSQMKSQIEIHYSS